MKILEYMKIFLFIYLSLRADWLTSSYIITSSISEQTNDERSARGRERERKLNQTLHIKNAFFVVTHKSQQLILQSNFHCTQFLSPSSRALTTNSCIQRVVPFIFCVRVCAFFKLCRSKRIQCLCCSRVCAVCVQSNVSFTHFNSLVFVVSARR